MQRYKSENEKLKSENRALTRVVSKLTAAATKTASAAAAAGIGGGTGSGASFPPGNQLPPMGKRVGGGGTA